MTKITVQFDGACFGNPGPMGIGVAVLKEGKVVARISHGLGHGTNNIAEYSAALRGLTEAKKLGATEVNMQGDSQLIIKQLKGEYEVKNSMLKELHMEIKRLEKTFASVKYEWIPRERNTVADELSKIGASK